MSGYSLEEIAGHYGRMSDDHLRKIIVGKARDLKPGVMEIIEAEISRRKLDTDILRAAYVQSREYSYEELVNYADIVRSQNCPYCGRSKYRLNGSTSHIVRSFVLFSVTNVMEIIACPDCLDKRNNAAIRTSLLMGFWSFEGLYKTPMMIYRNVQAKTVNKQAGASEVLLAFIQENIGLIELHKNDPEQLRLILLKKGSLI